MSLGDELTRLHELHRGGALSEEPVAPPVLDAINALRRSRSDRWIAGVCGGLARATGAETWVWQLGFALLFLCGGAGLAIHLLMWIFVPIG